MSLRLPAPNRTRERLIMLALFGLTVLVFSRVLFADFVRFDDDQTIYRNPHIQGLDFDRISWMLTNADHAVRYKPLSWLAYALIYQVSGLNAWGYHAASVLVHGFNTVLLFVVIRRILGLSGAKANPTKANVIDGSAALAALLWAVNPMRVEPVAWVTTFSYSLSFFFLLISLWYYLRLTPDASNSRPSAFFFQRAVVMFALAMLCFPFAFGYVLVLIALDWYPLRRINWVSPWWRDPLMRRVALEKIPFALLGGLICVTLWARVNTTGLWTELPTTQNLNPIKQAIQACYVWSYYLWKPWWPGHLSPMYHNLIAFNPREWVFLLNGVLAVALTGLVWWRGRQWRGLLVLWVAHGAFLLSALGLTERAHVTADRYSYIPGLTWAVLVAATIRWLLTSYPKSRKPIMTLAVALVAVWSALSFHQMRHWRNTETLFGHMLQEIGDRHAPSRSIMYGYLGMHSQETGRTNEAIRNFQLAVNAFYSPPGHHSLANLLEASGDYAGAVTNYIRLIQHNGDPLARVKYGAALLKQGRTAEALAQHRLALERYPDFVPALDGLAWLLATTPEARFRNGAEAVQLAERACALSQNQYAKALQTLAAEYARVGNFEAAVTCGRRAIQLADAASEVDLAKKNKELIELYQLRRPYEESASPIRSEASPP